MDMEQHGIYVIECRENQHRYVGGTIVSFKKRHKNHLSTLAHGKHHSPALQADWNAYGADAFTFRILEVVDDKDLIPDREVYWMNELQPEYNGKYVAIGYGGKGAPEHTPGKSVVWRQTISDELAAAIDARRGLLSRQEFTTNALVAAIEQPNMADLLCRIDTLQRRLDALESRPQVVPLASCDMNMASGASSAEMLSF